MSWDSLAKLTGHIHPLNFFEPVEILFSIDVNAVDSNCSNEFLTSLHKVYFKKILSKIISLTNKTITDYKIESYSISEISGYYLSENNELFEEQSFSLKIFGIEDYTAQMLAKMICISFKQESVLLRIGEENELIFNKNIKINNIKPIDLNHIISIVDEIERYNKNILDIHQQEMKKRYSS